MQMSAMLTNSGSRGAINRFLLFLKIIKVFILGYRVSHSVTTKIKVQCICIDQVFQLEFKSKLKSQAFFQPVLRLLYNSETSFFLHALMKLRRRLVFDPIDRSALRSTHHSLNIFKIISCSHQLAHHPCILFHCFKHG